MKNYKGYIIKDSGEYDGSCYVIGNGICFLAESKKHARQIIDVITK